MNDNIYLIHRNSDDFLKILDQAYLFAGTLAENDFSLRIVSQRMLLSDTFYSRTYFSCILLHSIEIKFTDTLTYII